MDEENYIEVNDIENNIVDISFNNIVDNSSNRLSICDLDYEKQEEGTYNYVILDVCKSLDISKEQVSKTLNKYINNNTEKPGKVNPLYDYVPFDFSILEYSEEELSAKLNYVKKADSKKTIATDINWLYEYSNTWINKIVYYWIGLTNNLIHKRRYLEYSEKLAGLETRLKNIQKNFESQEIITDDLIKEFFSDLYDCYRSLDIFFEDFIKFMCNSRAPIGEFFEDYQSIKDNVFNKCSVMKNELFLKTISNIEIKKYVDFNEPVQAVEFCKSNFPEEFKQLEYRLEYHIKEDEFYVEKEKFLFALKKFLLSNSERPHRKTTCNSILYAAIRYSDRSDALSEILLILFILNKLFMKLDSYTTDNRKIINEQVVKILKNCDEAITTLEQCELAKESDMAPYSESVKEQIKWRLQEVKSMANSPEEEVYVNIDWTYKDILKTSKYVSKMCFWKRYNLKMINDINEILILFFRQYKSIIKITKSHSLLCRIKKCMNDCLVIENRFKKMIFHWSPIDEFKMPNYFNEKEIWWFYCINKENGSKRPSWAHNPIRDFSYYNNYIRYERNIKRLPYPLSNDVNWDEIGMDVDRLEYSKRHHYFVNECLNIISNKDNFSFMVGDKVESNYKGTGKWNIATITNIHENEKYDIEFSNGETEENIEINLIRSLKESGIINLMSSIQQQKDDLKELEKKELLQNRIIKTNDVILQLKKMGEFMKEGVLINDQLFFKFILFAINFLIFIGQYFWNNHIEPEL
jgi:hypothetical protein